MTVRDYTRAGSHKILLGESVFTHQENDIKLYGGGMSNSAICQRLIGSSQQSTLLSQLPVPFL